jgi:hypothetical protein
MMMMMRSARQQRGAHDGVTNTTTLRGCRFCGSRGRLCRRRRPPRFEKNETSTFVVVVASSSSSPGRRQMMMTTTTTMTMTMTSPFVERERFFARAEGVPAFPNDDDDDDASSSSTSSCGVKSLTVGQNPGEFSTISRALEASAEEGGATISIQSGTYKERVVVNKPNVRLIGLSEDVYVEWRTSTPYESALEVATGVTNASVENVKFTHASKSVANNFGVFVREGGSLTLRNATVTSETGSGVATEGGSIDAENVKIDKCKNHGVSAFGNQLEEPKSGKVRMENVAISNCGGDGILLRGGVQIDSVDVKIENCAGFGVEAFENVQGKIAKCKISKCKKGNVGGDNDNYDGNGVSIELA